MPEGYVKAVHFATCTLNAHSMLNEAVFAICTCLAIGQ